MKKITILFSAILIFIFIIFSVTLYWLHFFDEYKGSNFQDFSRLEPEKVLVVDKASTTEQLVNILKDANEKKLNVSISGSRHSQGGHTYYKDNVVIDMRDYNKVLSIDEKNKTIIVQAGAKWSDVQEALNPYNLAVKVMQSSNVFTVGGTLSANAHGRDIDQTEVVETVESFRLLTAEGKILNISRTENSELFKLVIGGYGLFGIILDVTLHVTENEYLSQKSTVVSYKDFAKYFYENVRDNDEVRMFLARPSISNKTFFDEIAVTTWNRDNNLVPEEKKKLTGEKNVWRDKFFFNLSRKTQWAKDLRWYLQKQTELGVGEEREMTRNNAMRPPLAPLEFLEYYSKEDTDIIQEYYIPISNFVLFVEKFRKILKDENVNVISFTIRYVKKNNETYLPYCSKEDCFAVIFMANVGLDKDSQNKVEHTTQEITDIAIDNGGTYYLTYQLYPTREQITKMYPNWDQFISLKKKYDPNELFINKFYKKYE